MSSTGQIIGTVIGGAVGLAFPAVGFALGASIGGMAGALLDPPKGPHTTGPRLDDLSFQSGSYGTDVFRAYGTVPVVGAVIWLEGDKYHEVEVETEAGGKGGGSSSSSTSYTYYATFAVHLLRRQSTTQKVRLKRMWIGSNLVLDEDGTASVSYTFYDGSDPQTPNARMQADKGAANVSGYPGDIYVVINDLNLTPYSNTLQMAQVKCEIVVTETITEVEDRTEYLLSSGLGATTSLYPYCCVFNKDGSTSYTKSISEDANTFTAGFYQYKNDAVIQIGAGQIKKETWGTLSPIKQVVTTDGKPLMAAILWESSPYTHYRVVVVSPDGVVLDGVIRWSEPNNTLSVSDDWLLYDDGCVYIKGWHAPDTGSGGRIFKVTAGGDPATWLSSPFIGLVQWTLAGYGLQPGVTEDYVYVADSQSSATLLSVVKIRKSDLAVIETLTFSDYNGSSSWQGYIRNIYAYSDSVVYLATTYGQILKLESGALSVVGTEGSILTNRLSNIFLGGTGYQGFSYFEVSHSPRFFVKSMGNACPTGTPNANLYGIRTYTTVENFAPYPLQNIVEAECVRSGLGSGDIDLSLLTNTNVRGMRVTGGSRGALEQLQAIYPFDLSPRGYKVAFVSRGGAALATIPEGDLGAVRGGESTPVLLPESREMDAQIPRTVRVKHLDPDREYDLGEQLATRPGTASRNERTVETGIVLTSTEAAQAADRLNQKDWRERVEYGPFTLPPTWGRQEPADIVTMNYRGMAFTLRLTKIEYLSDGRLECYGKLTQGQSYTSTATGVNPAVISQAVVAIRGDTEALMLDIPRILAAQDAAGWPTAIYGEAPAWNGGSLMVSADDGTSYTKAASSSVSAKVFIALDVIGAGQPYKVDNGNVLTVFPASTGADVSSITADQLYNYGNLAAYGAAGRWEIVAFKTVSVSGANRVISGWLRGLFGTEEFCATHTYGDKLVMLDAAALQFVPLPTYAIGTALRHVAVTFGQMIDTADYFAATYNARNLKPLAPVSPVADRIGNDWVLACSPRTRTPVPLFSGQPQPVGETVTAYDLVIFSSSAYSTVKRTFSGLSTPSASYPQASQISDFGAVQSTLHGAWYQQSAAVGRGSPVYFSITG